MQLRCLLKKAPVGAVFQGNLDVALAVRMEQLRCAGVSRDRLASRNRSQSYTPAWVPLRQQRVCDALCGEGDRRLASGPAGDRDCSEQRHCACEGASVGDPDGCPEHRRTRLAAE